MHTASTSTLHRLSQWALELDLRDVPMFVIEEAKNQVLSMLAAIHAGHSTSLAKPIYLAFPAEPDGKSHIVPTGEITTPKHAAFVMSTLSMVLDYDDVMLGGHTGHSSVLVPIAYAETLNASGSDVLCAQIIANELAARVNMSVSIGAARGQMACYLHLVGAAAARAKLEDVSVEQFSNAIAFSLSYPAKTLYPSFLGSDAKALCASWPIQTALEAVDAVLAGMRGYDRLLDDPQGFIETFADIPVRSFFQGLGVNWHTATNSYKIYPASAYLNGILDAAISIARKKDIKADKVERIDVYASIFTLGMEALSSPYFKGPESTISTLTFSTPFTVACAVLNQSFSPDHLCPDRIKDPKVWSLAKKVHLHHDIDSTISALRSDIPIGAALKSIRPYDIFRYMLGMSGKKFTRKIWREQPWDMCRLLWALITAAANRKTLDFTSMEKRLGAKVRISLTDGNAYEDSVVIPQGFAGSGDWKVSRKIVRKKYLDSAIAQIGVDAANKVVDLIERMDELDPKEIMELITLNCIQTPNRQVKVKFPES